MLTDIEIAQQSSLLPIREVAASIGISEEDLEYYGTYKAKLSDAFYEKIEDRPDGKLVLVTAINPTPAGEGKTTTTVGLGEAMKHIGKRAIIALREPSLGPVMGIKGGAAGGGYAQVVPMEDINLHFTGDMHAITAAHNLLSALIDNHIQQGNALSIDTRRIVWKRVMDMNDRALRHIIVGLGGKANGTPREDGFMITVASEVMAILCLAKDREDLKNRLGNILVAYTTENTPVYAKDLHAAGPMTLLLKDAIKPNLVQTLEHTPCLMHGGPFANIAHGCNSIRATKTALKLADIVLTEAGFGADLGAEKFLDIKCRYGGFAPSAIVLVATVRALKYNGGMAKTDLQTENLFALRAGLPNLIKHVENLQSFGIPILVVLNRFSTDTDQELAVVKEACEGLGAEFALSEVFKKGGEGGIECAEKLISILDTKESHFTPCYEWDLPIADKIKTIATKIYGAKNVEFTQKAKRDIARFEEMGFRNLPICMAKTQYSFSDNPLLLGRPEGFTLHIKEVSLSSGAGFIVALTGDIMTMPGLPKIPSAEKMDIDKQGNITGLF